MSDPFETPDDPISQMLANPRSRVQRGENDDGTPDGTYWILLNDLFVPAADGEDIPPDEFPEVLRRWRTRGWWGILDWVIQRRYVSGVRAAPREPSPRVAEIRALVDEYEHANAATVATMGLPAGYGVVRLALIRELLDMVESRPVRELSVEGLAAMLDEMPWRVVEETRGDNADAAYWLLGRIGAGVGGERAAGEGEPK